MIRLIFLALVLAAILGSSAQADERLQPGRIEPFDVRAQDGRRFAWLERWLRQNQPDDAKARTQAMAYALSASERRRTLAREIGADPETSTGTPSNLSQSHLGSVDFMAEVRWREDLGNAQVPGIDDLAAPRWYTRHLCAGVLVGTDWVLTAAHCVTEPMLAAGIEVALGTTDLAHDEGLIRGVDRMTKHPTADLALLHLTGPSDGYPARQIAPAVRNLRPANRSEYFSVLGWGSYTNAFGQPIATYRHSIVFDPGDEAVPGAECGATAGSCLSNRVMRYCLTDSGGPVYSFSKDDGPQLVGMLSWDQTECFRPPFSDEKHPTAAPIIRLDQYGDWLTAQMAAPAEAR
jgi:hypothetical protein